MELGKSGDETLRAGQSQAYLSHVGAKGPIFIDCDDPALGLVRFISVGVGIGDVSSRHRLRDQTAK